MFNSCRTACATTWGLNVGIWNQKVPLLSGDAILIDVDIGTGKTCGAKVCANSTQLCRSLFMSVGPGVGEKRFVRGGGGGGV